MDPLTDQPWGAARLRLTRSAEDRVLGGVCGGLGRHLGVDPVLFRILAVALVFAGGLGLLAYLVAWLSVPGEGGTVVANKSKASKVVVAVLGGFLLVWAWTALSWAGRGMWDLVVVVAVLGAVVLLMHHEGYGRAWTQRSWRATGPWIAGPTAPTPTAPTPTAPGPTAPEPTAPGPTPGPTAPGPWTAGDVDWSTTGPATTGETSTPDDPPGPVPEAGPEAAGEPPSTGPPEDEPRGEELS